MVTITKQLAGMEDLLTRRGPTNQLRGKDTVAVHGIDVPFAVDTENEMQLLDPDRFTYARVYTSIASFGDYIYNPDPASGGIPSLVGEGTWVSAGTETVQQQENVTLDDGQTAVDFTLVNTTVASFYLHSGNADSGKLKETLDYTIATDKRILLTSSYPAGTIIEAIVGESLVTSFSSTVKTANTLSLLKRLNLIPGITAITQGYYDSGDQGSAAYIVEEAKAVDGYGDHLLDNGNSLVLVKQEPLQVYQYGARGDGVVDDSGSFNAIRSAAIGSIYLPPGNFNVPSGDYTGVKFHSYGGASTNNGTIVIKDLTL